MQNRGESLWVLMVGTFLVIVMLMGCTQSPENSPLFRKKMAELTTLQEEVADLKDQVLRISSENEALKEEIRTLKERPTAKSSVAPEEIKRLSEELTQASHKVAEAMYQQASQEAGAQPGAGPEGGAQPGAGAAAPEDDVVDADFEEVKDDKK